MRLSIKEQLSGEEFERLVLAIPQVAVLVGGADGDFDESEKAWTSKLVAIRGYNSPDELEPLYNAAAHYVGENLHGFYASYPEQTEARIVRLENELSQLNAIFSKLDPHSARLVYDSLRSLAWHVARTSGGFLRFGSISSTEEKWVSLPMLVKPPDFISEEE
jgi:hypothetical protein